MKLMLLLALMAIIVAVSFRPPQPHQANLKAID
jgi:hypothetical protein